MQRRHVCWIVWIERVLRQIADLKAPVLLEGGDDWGASFVLDALSARGPVAWVTLESADQQDFVAQGNALASAVNRAVGARLLPMALPYAANLRMFLQQRTLVDPLTIAVQDAGWAPAMAADVAALHDDRTRVVLVASDPARLVLPEGVVRFGPKELALTPTEAAAMMTTVVPPAEIERLWRRARGRYPELVRSLAQLTGRPVPALPRPDGSVLDRRDALRAEPDEVIDALMRSGDWIRAVELAVMSSPGRLPELLPHGGPSYQRLGLLRRLHLLLESIDLAWQQDEVVLTWRYLAAFAVGRAELIRPLVETWLLAHEAPELRARHAGVLPDLAEASAEAERAARARETPLTLFQYGRLHPDADEGIRILVRSVDVAEAHDADYDVVRNAGALAERLAHAGRFDEAVSWGAWGLAEYDRRDIQDGKRRLRLFNNWAYASILTGRPLGLEAPLEELPVALEGTLPSLAANVRATAAAFELSRGNAREACRLARANLPSLERRHQGRFALEVVRTLVELGDIDEALRIGESAARLAQVDAPYYYGTAITAYGVAQALANPGKAVAPLRESMAMRELPAETRCIAALYWMLAAGANAAALPAEVRKLFADLDKSGLRALSGPEAAFHAIWGQLLGEASRLELRFFGGMAARMDGKLVRLTRTGAEILLLLSENPDGLTEEQLHARLFEDGPGVEPVTIRVRVSRLRERVAVTDSPYRLAVAFDSDLARLRRRIDQGDVVGAVELYTGALLPGSDAAGVRTLRSSVEELLRHAVIQRGTLEAVLKLATMLGDDLAVWESALERVPPSDPRAVVVRAKVAQLRREFIA